MDSLDVLAVVGLPVAAGLPLVAGLAEGPGVVACGVSPASSASPVPGMPWSLSDGVAGGSSRAGGGVAVTVAVTVTVAVAVTVTVG
ncbi:hypothetical protein WBK31_20775 [Nonomuraea sp. N2-4H]|uniref:hypothetical protein n=1 Tax=Nonomuraea sp. N2-4H TaxID=3128898 RepID=UPI00324AEF1E